MARKKTMETADEKKQAADDKLPNVGNFEGQSNTDDKLPNVWEFEDQPEPESKLLNVEQFGDQPTGSDGLVALSKQQQQIDAMFAFVGDYSYESDVAALCDDVKVSAMRMLMAGCRLIRIKEHEEHGRFMQAVEKCGLDRNSAWRFMNAATKFVSDKGQLKYQQLAQLGVSKIYELAMEDDEILKGLEDGETVAGMTIEEIDRMSVRELKQKLRDAKKDKEALEKLVEAKNAKLDEQEKQLITNDRQGRPVTDWSEKARSLADEVNGLLIQASQFCSRINAMADEVLSLPCHGYSNEASVVMLTLRNAAAILYEEAEATGARLDCLEPEAPEYLASTGLAGLGIEVDGDV